MKIKITRRGVLGGGASLALIGKRARSQILVSRTSGFSNVLSQIGTGISYASSQSKDTFVSTTLSALADLSGKGNGWAQVYKPWQPAIGGFGGLLCSNGLFFDCVNPLMLTGLSAITMGFTFALDAGAAQRSLMTLSNAAASNDVLSLNFTNAASPTLFAHVNANDSGISYTTSAGAALSIGAKHTLVCRLDLSGTVNIGVGTIDLVLDGASYLGAPAMFSLTGSPPWPLAPTEYPLSLRIGNTQSLAIAAPSPDRALLGEVTGAIFLAEYSNADRLAALNSWLAAQ